MAVLVLIFVVAARIFVAVFVLILVVAARIFVLVFVLIFVVAARIFVPVFVLIFVVAARVLVPVFVLIFVVAALVLVSVLVLIFVAVLVLDMGHRRLRVRGLDDDRLGVVAERLDRALQPRLHLQAVHSDDGCLGERAQVAGRGPERVRLHARRHEANQLDALASDALREVLHRVDAGGDDQRLRRRRGGSGGRSGRGRLRGGRRGRLRGLATSREESGRRNRRNTEVYDTQSHFHATLLLFGSVRGALPAAFGADAAAAVDFQPVADQLALYVGAHCPQHPLDGRVAELVDPPAVHADEVMVVAGVVQRVAGRAVGHRRFAERARVHQQPEGAVDGRAAHAVQLGGEVLGAEGVAAAGERGGEFAARLRDAAAAVLQRCDDVVLGGS